MDQEAADRLVGTPRQRMGQTVRGLRHRRKLTLVQLAGLTGLSHSFLSQVERGLAQPSMRSLHRIAQALGATQDQLIAGATEGGAEVAVLRRGEGVPIPTVDRVPGSTGAARQLLSGPGGFFPTEFVGLDKEFGEFFRHDGNEFLYIAEGVVEVDLGDVTYVLEPGDCLRYPGDRPHRWRGMGQGRSRVLMVHTGVAVHPLAGDR
ncbi:helix-turn-helix domain-containing protein [Amycolatopsis rhizosphaerae]|uniref:Helix-turn-helix domain-containing protein n=1 Tax=Amycolatopsis rhizosphaerae TaxID=2053003 RepID=A0A558DPJ0_9PSEU|nr:XRE family transcriptional regulator [Amycolatopsis rhizosphaerae]TVT62888.1 helix-turn-helix domain-containing protein [Amycolatopsis rhizosphaerae]